MARSSRPSGKAAQLDLIDRGEMTVAVARPFDPPLPADLSHGWNDSRTGGRPSFGLQHAPTQAVLVSYQVYNDPLQMADLRDRALRNKGGTAVRGYARADKASGQVSHGITRREVASLVRRAANSKGLRTSNGPASARVRFLEQPTGFPATCHKCRHTLAEHQPLLVESQGDWDRDQTTEYGGHPWNNDLVRTDTYYLCPIPEGGA